MLLGRTGRNEPPASLLQTSLLETSFEPGPGVQGRFDVSAALNLGLEPRPGVAGQCHLASPAVSQLEPGHLLVSLAGPALAFFVVRERKYSWAEPGESLGEVYKA